eukprot:TRINITY_DN2004_c1_g2_i2.p1 TRINITY_DN2004_c1_g2~~TRINITY_DN2004_c1_g2_i2.p1  ORF type:complete len:183 (-),score=18.85 TRINITY_DN2004_c1_g2_i2:86-592(-)
MEVQSAAGRPPAAAAAEPAEICQTCLNCDHYQGNGVGPCGYCGCFRQNHLQPRPIDAESLDTRGIPRLDCLDCGEETCPKFLVFEPGSGRAECKRCFCPAGRHRVKSTYPQLQTQPLAQADGGVATHTNANTFGAAEGAAGGLPMGIALTQAYLHHTPHTSLHTPITM